MRCVVLQAGRDSDYCLTTFLSGLSFCINFHVSTFFYRHSNQRGDLCTPHKFQRCIILFFRMSQFSDARCRGFESPRPQRAVLFGHCSFYLKVPIITKTLCYTGRKGLLPLIKIRSGPHQKAHSTRGYSGRRRGFMVYWWQLTERSNRRTRLWRT